jgi:hypothetical protein
VDARERREAGRVVGEAMNGWIPRIVWLAGGALLGYAWTDFDMPWGVTAWLAVASIGWLAVGVWWVRRGER